MHVPQMDRITASMLTTYATEAGISGSESRKFECFAAYCVLSPKTFEAFDVEELIVGDNSTPGIDALAILVNGQVVADEDEIAGILNGGGSLEVRIIFVQAKTSPKFEGKVMLDFADEVSNFFTRDLDDLHANLRGPRAVVDSILSQGIRLRDNPECVLVYATPGRWLDDTTLIRKAETARQSLANLNYFSSVNVEYADAHYLQREYRASKQQVSAEFDLVGRTTVASVLGISQAYIGILPAREFLKVITDDGGELRGGIFEGNVRDFQGLDNEVNRKMRDTLSTAPDRFVVLNNGVTVVAKSGAVVGDHFTINDFQIVNGCQTANVLFDARSDARFGEAAVSLRVVVTDDDEIANSITAATNSQTAVRDEELYSLLAFQRSLEQFFLTYTSPQDLYFERRSKQYQSTGTPKNRVVTRAQMVKAFASTYLGFPHRATGYYTSLYKASVGAKLFDEGQNLEGYYAAAVAQFRLESLLKSSELPSSIRPARYQLLHAARHLATGSEDLPLNSKQHQKSATQFAEILWNPAVSLELFSQAAKVLVEVAGKNSIDRDFTKRQTVTNDVARRCAEVRNESARGTTWLVS